MSGSVCVCVCVCVGGKTWLELGEMQWSRAHVGLVLTRIVKVKHRKHSIVSMVVKQSPLLVN